MDPDPVCGDRRELDRMWRTLSPREAQIARLAAGGRRTSEIARALGLSRNTVDAHLKHIYSKLYVQTRTQLASFFLDYQESQRMKERINEWDKE